MKKYLKTSYIRRLINLYFIRFILNFVKYRFRPQGRVLLKSNDVIGDFILRSKLVELIEKKYGKENIYIIMQPHFVSLAELFGYKAISYSRKERKYFSSRLKKMYEINLLGFSTYIDLEYEEDIDDIIFSGNIFAPERIGIKNEDSGMVIESRFFTKSFPLKNEYVLKQVADMVKGILDEDVIAEEMIPDIRNIFKPEDGEDIVVAIGSSGRFKICSPILLASCLKEVRKKYPTRNILLLGSGEKEDIYAKRVIEMVGAENMINLIGKTSFYEAFDLVAKSFLFIGFDSGLYNACFALRKKGIILFQQDDLGYIHKVPWLEVVIPRKVREDIIDKDYPDFKINSIDVEDFKAALDKQSRN